MTGSGAYAIGEDSARPDANEALYRVAFGSSRIWLVVVAAQCLAFLAGFGLGLTVLQLALVALLPWPLLQAVVVVRSRRRWPAQEVLVELDLVSTAGWRAKGGGPATVDAASGFGKSASRIERDLRLGFNAALVAVGRGGDAIGPLVAARASAGRLPGATARRVLLARYRHAIASVVVGVWLLAALLVGMATAGGVVWF